MSAAVQDRVRICTRVKPETAIYLYSISKAMKLTIGDIIDALVERYGQELREAMGSNRYLRG